MIDTSKVKLYHIVHIDRLASIIDRGGLFSDRIVRRDDLTGTNIGNSNIKNARLDRKIEDKHSLTVGDCVPFYFAPRSVMLYVIKATGGQEQVIHLEFEYQTILEYLEISNKRKFYTCTNARANYTEFHQDFGTLSRLNWNAINAKNWTGCKEEKQAEFLVETMVPWQLVKVIGVQNSQVFDQVKKQLEVIPYKPEVKLKPDWYY
ncbi:MAG: DUF4433 domain-containing protein [Candidatus Pacebacteria bacterium]|nr:DUF4433 domain-containing protein [Candidatus Paceibacterota bacterium]